jgi:hypothetical protein
MKQLNEVIRMQQLAGINEIKINIPSTGYKYCWIDSHENYEILNLANEQSFQNYLKKIAEENDMTTEEYLEHYFEYLEKIPQNKIIFIGWNDEGPNVWGYDDLYGFLKDITIGYWGENQIIEELDEIGYNGEEDFNNWYENGNDKNIENEIFKILKTWINNSEADGDSSDANCLIIHNKIVAGEDNIQII